MKTLYININSKPISPSEELVVMDYDLTSDFFFYLGERIGKGCKIQNENALITDFNTPENNQDYDLILSQWYEVKRLLFSEDVAGSFDFELPSGYLHWLRYNEDYNHVYEANFSNGGSRLVKIDLKELYEDSVEYLQRKIMRLLQKEDLYLQIDEIVFNDEDVTCKSKIVCTIKKKYEGIGFRAYKKWLKDHKNDIKQKETFHQQYDNVLKWPIDLDCIEIEKITNLGYIPTAVIGHDDIDYIILANKDNNRYVMKSSGKVLYMFEYQNAIPTLTGKYIIVENHFHKLGLIRAFDGKDLLPATYCRSGKLNEIEPGFFFNEKGGIYCAKLDVHCEVLGTSVFVDKRYHRLYSKKTWKYFELKNLFPSHQEKLSEFMCWDIKQHSNYYIISTTCNLYKEYTLLTNEDVDKVYKLRRDEEIDKMDNGKIHLYQYGQLSAIIDYNMEFVYKAQYILEAEEKVIDESEGMTIIMNGNVVTRILDEQFNDIIEDINIGINKPIHFQNGIACFQISKKKIGCIKKNGEIIEIPWKYGNTISEIDVFAKHLILVKKTSGERFIINLLGESVVDIRNWDIIRNVSENLFEINNNNNTTLYEIKGNKVFEVL